MTELDTESISDELNLSSYHKAVEAATHYYQPDTGYLRITGSDRVQFLQRQTTNDLSRLLPGYILTTVLTSPTARILDVLTLLIEQRDPKVISVITLPGYSSKTRQFLQSRIFFMDKVTIQDSSADFGQIDLIGPSWNYLVPNLGIDHPPAEDEIQYGQIGSTPVRAFNHFELGIRLLFPSSGESDVVAALARSGSEEISSETYGILRVEAGVPSPAHELTEDYTPLEAGLEKAISTEKGCYTGQEVLARQITYNKVTRQLVGLRLTSQSFVDAPLRSPEDHKNVGEITSVAHSPRYGFIAIGMVKQPYYQPGTRLIVGDPKEGHSATVSSPPFKS